ncbi:MAG: hypothetical protein LBO00_03170, partial [Zoogloeaceae bacterium]|nr:hypothetical protein [Zoogloeaceae bacterium]
MSLANPTDRPVADCRLQIHFPQGRYNARLFAFPPFSIMELAKSFEPADIERRWYPEWESRNYFAAGLDTAKPAA